MPRFAKMTGTVITVGTWVTTRAFLTSGQNHFLTFNERVTTTNVRAGKKYVTLLLALPKSPPSRLRRDPPARQRSRANSPDEFPLARRCVATADKTAAAK